MTIEQMDAIIDAYAQAFPGDFGNHETWEREERQDDETRHTQGGSDER